MAEKLGEALLDLDTNDKRLNAGIDRAEKKATGLGERFDDVSRRAVALGKTMAVAAAAGATALGYAILQTTRSLAEMSAEAKMAGVNVEDFQRLKYVAQQNLIGVEALTDGLKELNLRADEFIVTGTGSAAEAFQRLGMGATELKQKLADPSALFTEIIGKLSHLDTAAQIRILDELFGGSGGEQFMRLMDGGAEGVKRLTDEFERLGLAVSATDIAAIEAFNAEINKIEAMVQGFVTQITVGAVPAMRAFIESVSDSAGDFGGLELAVDGAIWVIKELMVFLAEAKANLDALSATLWSVGRAMEFMKQGDASGALATLQQTGLETDQIFRDLAGTIDRIRNGTSEGEGGASGTLPARTGGSGNVVGLNAEVNKAEQLLQSLRDERDILRETDPVQQRLISMRESLAKATVTQRDEAEQLIRTIYEETRAWEGAQQAGQFFGDQLLGSIEALRTGSKSLTEVLNDVVNALAQAVLQSMLLGQGPLASLFGTSNAKGGLGGIFGGLLSKFAGGFYQGGLIPNGSFGIVGERGPELAFGTSAGTRILSNSASSDFMGGQGMVNNITINGSGLSKSEMREAISEALDSFNRFQLPVRVQEINSDPLARG
ncbi:phage tail tape measure protein [Devosia sp.]|uniref:phage tail tape measure protein n=1 Tax=Devosia sp. TaxID=1871048 RepID=UPI001ACFA37A|nr:phage tail tape measure protein [Devosia sp.]MBN9334964.1 phage tail tape measure protein [Devosia sp.]